MSDLKFLQGMGEEPQMRELEYLQGLCDRLRERLGVEGNVEILETVIHLQDEVARVRWQAHTVLNLIDRLDAKWGGRTMHDDVQTLRGMLKEKL